MENNLDKIKALTQPFMSIQELFDPIQTHAVYGIRDKNDLDVLKYEIKEAKLGNRFRQIKNQYGFYTLCFKLK